MTSNLDDTTTMREFIGMAIEDAEERLGLLADAIVDAADDDHFDGLDEPSGYTLSLQREYNELSTCIKHSRTVRFNRSII
jgi:maltooligosyltrehalose synthase